MGRHQDCEDREALPYPVWALEPRTSTPSSSPLFFPHSLVAGSSPTVGSNFESMSTAQTLEMSGFVFLLTVYIIMALILLLNLLIAVRLDCT